MSKAKIVRDSEGLFYGIRINCPGCLYDDGTPSGKVLPVNWLPPGETQESPHVAGKPHWSFNVDFDKPVLGPSVLQTWDIPEACGNPELLAEQRKLAEADPSYRYPMKRQCCHSFVGCNGAAPGQIIFLGDCTHALAGQTVPLAEFPEGWGC